MNATSTSTTETVFLRHVEGRYLKAEKPFPLFACEHKDGYQHAEFYYCAECDTWYECWPGEDST